jgi:NAD+ kinase
MDEIVVWLKARGVTTWMYATENKPPHPRLEASDLLITLGGDGTILRAVPFTAPLNIPLLGINLGRVGFLTECMPDMWPETLEKIMAGEGQVEKRMMLQVHLLREGEVIHRDAGLNDIVVSRGGQARIVHLDVRIDDAKMTCYVADGLIIATATGSTAYSYAVGGPVLPPWIENIILVPVAPHLSFDRPLVMDANSHIDVTVHTRMPAMLTVDGRLAGTLQENDRISIQRSPLVARFLRLGNRSDFYRTLVARLTPHAAAVVADAAAVAADAATVVADGRC